MNQYLLFIITCIIVYVIAFLPLLNYISNYYNFEIYNKSNEIKTIIPVKNTDYMNELYLYLTSNNMYNEMDFFSESANLNLLGKLNIPAINKIYIEDKINTEVHTDYLFDCLHYLDNIESKMYNNSDNFKNTSCECLDQITFNKGFQIINITMKLFNYLFVYNNPCYYLMHTEKLFDKFTLFYRYINKKKIIKIGGIETVFVSNHHHATEWVYKKFKGNTLPTILHIDTHPDEEGIFQNILDDNEFNNIKNNINNKDTLIHFYKNIIRNDIGSVIIPMILPYNNNNGVIWIRPKWCVKNINTMSTQKIMRGKYYNINYNDDDPDEYNYFYSKSDNIDDISKVDNNFQKTYKKYVTYIHNIDINSVPKNFILNIDLDYFVSFGDENSYDDPISHSRTVIDKIMIHRNNSYFNIKSNELNNEINLIRQRIDHFLIFLKRLKLQNKKPSFIILCNSSSINHYFLEPWENTLLFKEKIGNIDINNEYTPKYMSVWLQNTLLMHLKDIYEN